MEAIFIRHKIGHELKATTEILKITEILNKWWKEGVIAIHFENLASSNPEDYKSAGRKALTKLNHYCESGAFVGADFRTIHKDAMLVGEIAPHSKVEFERANGEIYKVVQLKNPRKVLYSDYPLLLGIQPRQGTITGWPSVKNYLSAIIKGDKIPFDVGSLIPHQLEVICYEYLRSKGIIDVLLMPIGRTLKDVDVWALDNKGFQVLAQVTHSKSNKDVSKKIDNLKQHKSADNKLIFFGPMSTNIQDEDILFVSIESVFDTLSSDKTASSYKMLCNMLGYQKSLHN